MKAIIVEDNLSNSWDYEMILDKLDIEVLGVFKSWHSAVAKIKNEIPDFMIVDLFLDHNQKGLDFIHEVKNYFIPTIICTGYPEKEYMDEALEAGVVAFISKPVDKASLTYQIKKLVKEIKSNNYKSNFLVIKNKRNLVKIPFKEIIKIEIDGNYSYIFLHTGKKYIIKLSLIKLTKELDTKKFIRCFRSTIVNLDYIASLDLQENKLLLNDGTSINVGTKYKNTVKEAFTGK